MERLLVACGDGIAASTVVTTRIGEKYEGDGVPIMINQCKLMGVDSGADDYDLLIATGKFTGRTVDVPVAMAASLLTRIGEGTALNQVVEGLKK